MKRLYNGFTLTEMLVALGVIAVLCAIILPMIYNVLPNKNTIMAKRAYYTIQTIVSEMINDETCYPDKSKDEDETRRRIGFSDGYGYEGCAKWGSTYLTSEDRMTKFKTIFFDKLGVAPPTTYGVNTTTDDGIRWSYSNTTNLAPPNGYFTLNIDVNGPKGPNCTDKAYTLQKCSDSSANYDQFTVNIYITGKVEFQSDWAAEAADISTGITK